MTDPIFDLLPDSACILFDGDGVWHPEGYPPSDCRVRVEFRWSVGTLIHFEFENESLGGGLLPAEGVLRLTDGGDLSDLVFINPPTAT